MFSGKTLILAAAVATVAHAETQEDKLNAGAAAMGFLEKRELGGLLCPLGKSCKPKMKKGSKGSDCENDSECKSNLICGSNKKCQKKAQTSTASREANHKGMKNKAHDVWQRVFGQAAESWALKREKTN